LDDSSNANDVEEEKRKKRIVEVPGWNHSSSLAEEIYDETDGKYKFAVYRPGDKPFDVNDVEYYEELYVDMEPSLASVAKKKDPKADPENEIVVIRPIVDKIVKDGGVVLPGRAAPYGSEDDLFAELMQFVDRWVDLRSTGSEYTTEGLDLKLYCAYIMLGWLMGAVDSYMLWNLRGPSDTGKTRIATIGHLLSYRSIQGSGASTHASLVRVVDWWRGNLYVNEGDLKHSGETGDYIKFLNARYSKDEGMVWKCDSTGPGGRRWKPETFYVFGPTIITTRQGFEDDALESRCFRVRPKATNRRDIPLTLPNEARLQAYRLRCKLLSFRFKNLFSFSVNPYLRFPGVQTRLSQIMQPIASLAKQAMPSLYKGLFADIRAINEGLVTERAESPFARQKKDVVTALDIRNAIIDDIGRPPGEVSVQGIGRRLRGLDFTSTRSKTPDRTRCIEITWEALYRNFVKYVPKLERDKFLDWLASRGFLNMSDDERKLWVGIKTKKSEEAVEKIDDKKKGLEEWM